VRPKDQPLPLAGPNSRLAWCERTDLPDGRFEIVYTSPLEAGASAAPRTTSFGDGTRKGARAADDDEAALAKPPAKPAADDEDAAPVEDEEEPVRPPSGATKLPPKGSLSKPAPAAAKAAAAAAPAPKKRGLPQRLQRLMPILLHEFHEFEERDEREMLYGDERATLLLPQLRRDSKKKAAQTHRGRGLAAHAEIKRLLPRLMSIETAYMEGTRRFAFEGARPESIHVLTRVLATPYKFRIEDLSHYTTHGDLVLRALERLDVSTSAFDLEGILYCPSVDAQYPFKFLVCGDTKQDNFVSYLAGLKKVFEHVEPIETFRERVFGELKLGFEKFGPGCATPEFQEVELRLWKLLGDAGKKMVDSVNEIVTATKMNGALIRKTLAELHGLHAAIDDCQHLPSTIAAYYRHHFDIPFGKLFEHALAAIDAIAKKVSIDLKDARPKNVDELAEIVSTVRKLAPRSPLENLEMRDALLAAAYEGKPAPDQEASPDWVRRYTEVIYTGAERFDQRRFAKDDTRTKMLGSDVEAAESDLDNVFEDMDDPFAGGIAGGAKED
jgi:hypothetical protein